MTNKLRTIPLLLALSLLVSCAMAQEKLYYCSNETGTYQVYVKNMETDVIESITSTSSFNYWWIDSSPDHEKLVLMRSPVEDGVKDQFDYENCQMLIVNADGSDEVIIVENNQNGWKAFGNPHWHPSGDRLIMLAQPTNEFFLFTINPDGSDPSQITTQFSLDPSWSHDGKEIVFVGINSDPTFPVSLDDLEIFTASYDYETNTTSDISQLTSDTLRNHDPCFSPDDDFIAFSSGSVDLLNANLVRINTDGSERTDLVADGSTNGGPVNWGSDNKIYYHNVKIFQTPFTLKSYDPATALNIDLTPTLQNGFISPSYVNLDDPDSSSSIEIDEELSVFPNPTTDGNIQISVSESFIGGELQVHRSDGVFLASKEIDGVKMTFDVSHLTSGSYILTCTKNRAQSTKTVIKL